MCYALCMKSAFKKWKVWLIAIILIVIAIAVPFIVLIITLNIEDASPFQYPLLLGAFAATYLLVGFIWGDLHTVSYRRKNKNWDDELPPEVKESAWSRRMPFYIAAVIVFTVFFTFEIIYWIIGHYPFL